MEGPFHLFIGFDYYPAGGVRDYAGAFATAEAAKAAARGHPRYRDAGWWAHAAALRDGRLEMVLEYDGKDWV